MLGGVAYLEQNVKGAVLTLLHEWTKVADAKVLAADPVSFQAQREARGQCGEL